jgi:hypothetical protein
LGLNFDLSLQGSAAAPEINLRDSARLSDGSYEIEIDGAVGQSFAIQVSTNFVKWQTIDIDTLQGGSFVFTDETAVGLRQRYYRVISLDALDDQMAFGIASFGLNSAAGFSLHLVGNSGQPFRLLTTTNLLDWSDLTSGILVNEAFDFTDSTTNQPRQRFYRAIKQ